MQACRRQRGQRRSATRAYLPVSVSRCSYRVKLCSGSGGIDIDYCLSAIAGVSTNHAEELFLAAQWFAPQGL